MKKTVFIGDGLTRGLPGVSYIRFLHNKDRVIRRGAVGDTLLGTSERVIKMLRDQEYDEVDTYVLQTGLNDVLLPVLSQHSKVWKSLLAVREFGTGCAPCSDAEEFKNRYEQLLVKLRACKKEVAVIGLPYMENKMLKMNDTLEEYNEILKALCQTYKVKFINLRELEKNAGIGKKGSYFYGKLPFIACIDMLLASILPFSNAVSKWRGLTVTIDGLHLNYRMAKRFAKIIEIRILD